MLDFIVFLWKICSEYGRGKLQSLPHALDYPAAKNILKGGICIYATNKWPVITR